MRILISRRSTVIAALLALATSISGCGGSGGHGAPQSRTITIPVVITWPPFGAGGADLTDAQSVNVTLKMGNSDGSDVNVNYNRTSPAASTDHFSVTANSPAPGPHELLMIFYNQVNGQANPNARIVGMADQTLMISANGPAILPAKPVSLIATVASVTVAAGQSLAVGSTFLPTFTAFDSAGNVVALAPTAAQFQVGAGSDKIEIVNVMPAGQTFTQEQIGGLNVGTATFSVTVAGKTSAPVDLTVTANPAAAAIAEASLSSGKPSVRITIDPAFGGAGTQQFKLFRLPDFPYAAFFNGGANGTTPPIPVGTAPPTERTLTDLASTYNYYMNGAGFLTGGGGGSNSQACVVNVPANAATLDTGFTPGSSYQYQVSAIVLTQATGMSAGCIEAGPALSGLITAVAPAKLTFPQNQTQSLDLISFVATFGSRAGADVFQLEISTDRSFADPTRIYRQELISTAPTSDDVTQTLPNPINLTIVPELLADPVFATFVKARSNGTPQLPTLYWRVGARHNADRPGPVHWISQNPNDPDRTFRYVYSPAFSFTPAPVPPPPPGRAASGVWRR